MPLRNKSGTAVCGFSKRIWGFRCSVSQGTHCRHFLSSLCLVCLSVHCCYGNVYSQSHHTFSRSQIHQNNVSEPHLDNTHPAIHTQRLTMLVHAKPMSNVDLHIKCISTRKSKEFPNSFHKKRKHTVSRIFSISLDLMSYDFFIIGQKQFLSQTAD